jgi:hypothetical protein
MLVLVITNDKLIERFSMEKDIDFEELNLALDHVLECEGKPVEKCLNQVRDYGTLKEILGYKDFDIGIFIKLMTKRRENKKTLTKGQIISILKKEKPEIVERTFRKTEGFAVIERMEDRLSVLNKCAEDLKKGREYAERENERYQQEYKAWKERYDADMRAWESRKQKATQEFNTARTVLHSNEIEFQGKPFTCGGGSACGVPHTNWYETGASAPCRKCACQFRFGGQSGKKPACNTDRIFDWLNRNEHQNCIGKGYMTNGPVIRPETRLETYLLKHKATDADKPNLANYPKPAKPVFQPLSVICQDCSQSQEKITVEESKGIDIKQINTCIAEIEGKKVEAQKAADEAAKKALLEKKAAEEKAATEKAAAEKRAEEEAAAAKRAESSGGDGVDTPSGEAENEGGINMLAIIGGGGVFFLFCSALIVGAIIWMYYNNKNK